MLFFCSIPKWSTQMGSLSAKNASKKFSCLGTFKSTAKHTAVVAGGGGVKTTEKKNNGPPVDSRQQVQTETDEFI
jgi:hypothetical protein